MAFPHRSGSMYEDSIVVLTLLPLIWIFICTRMYVRGFLIKQPGWDDITAVVAAIMYTLECVTVLVTNEISKPALHSPGPPSQQKIVLTLKLFMLSGSAYALSCLFVKLSVGLGYLRILKLRHLNSRWERWICYSIIVLSCAINLQLFFFALFMCASKGIMPVNLAFAAATGKCSLTNHGLLISAYLQSATNVVIDCVFVLLPIPSLFGIIIDRKTRLSIIGILLLGTGGSIASFIRVPYIHTFFTKRAGRGTVGSIVSHIEIGTFIIFGCLSTFHPLLTRLLSVRNKDYSEASSFNLKATSTSDYMTSKQESYLDNDTVEELPVT